LGLLGDLNRAGGREHDFCENKTRGEKTFEPNTQRKNKKDDVKRIVSLRAEGEAGAESSVDMFGRSSRRPPGFRNQKKTETDRSKWATKDEQKRRSLETLCR